MNIPEILSNVHGFTGKTVRFYRFQLNLTECIFGLAIQIQVRCRHRQVCPLHPGNMFDRLKVLDKSRIKYTLIFVTL